MLSDKTPTTLTMENETISKEDAEKTMWQRYVDIDYAEKGLSAQDAAKLPATCVHLSVVDEDAPVPEGKKFSLDIIRTRPMGEPIPLFGDATLTAGALYNALYEVAYAGDGKCDMNKVSDILDGIAEFLAAITYDRWAIGSTLDVEHSLADRIEKIYEENDVANAEMFPHAEPECDYNEEHFIFEPGDLLSEWVASAASRAVSALAMQPTGMDMKDDVCYYSSELYPGALPCFKEAGFDKMRDTIRMNMMDLMCSIYEQGTVVRVMELSEAMEARRGTGVKYVAPPVGKLIAESAVSEFRETGNVTLTLSSEDMWDDLLDYCERDEDAPPREEKVVLPMEDACIVFFDSTNEPYEQVGLVAALAMLGEIPDGTKRVLAVQAAKGVRNVRQVKALMEGYGFSAVTAVGYGMEWADELYETSRPGILVPDTDLRAGTYCYMDAWTDENEKLMTDAYAATQAMGLAFSIATAANEVRRATSATVDGDVAEGELSVMACEKMPSEWVRAMVSAATGGLISVPEYDEELASLDQSYGMERMKSLYQTEHAPKSDGGIPSWLSAREYHDPSLDKLYALSDVYNRYGVFMDGYRTFIPPAEATPLTKEAVIAAGKVIWQMACETDADLAVRAIADGVPLDDVLA